MLVEETARRRQLENRVVALLEESDFAEIVLPILDFAEPYAGIAGAADRQSYRFTDRDGELVTLRSDFTPMVARALAPAINGDLPLRVFYRGDVIRCSSTRLGANRELFQIGAELVGDASPAADIAMLSLAASLGAVFCEEPLVVYSGAHLGLDDRFVFHEEGDAPAGYYTGIRFWVYGTDRRTPLGQGGRYDTLYGRFGKGAPAIGFTFTVRS